MIIIWVILIAVVIFFKLDGLCLIYGNETSTVIDDPAMMIFFGIGLLKFSGLACRKSNRSMRKKKNLKEGDIFRRLNSSDVRQ